MIFLLKFSLFSFQGEKKAGTPGEGEGDDSQ